MSRQKATERKQNKTKQKEWEGKSQNVGMEDVNKQDNRDR